MKLLLLAVLITSGMLISLQLIHAQDTGNQNTTDPGNQNTTDPVNQNTTDPGNQNTTDTKNQNTTDSKKQNTEDSNVQDSKTKEPTTKSPANSQPSSFVNKNYNKLQLIINNKEAKKRKDEDSDEDEYDDYYYDLLSSMLMFGRKRRDTSDKELFNIENQMLPNIPDYMKNIDLRENIVPDYEDFIGPRTFKSLKEDPSESYFIGPRTFKSFMKDPSYVAKISDRMKRDVSQDKIGLEDEPAVAGLPKNVKTFEINPRKSERSRIRSQLNVHEGKERLKRQAPDDKKISDNEHTYENEDSGVPENFEAFESNSINSDGYRKPGGPRKPSGDDGRGHRGPARPKNDERGKGRRKGDEEGDRGHGGCNEGCAGRNPSRESGGKGHRRGAGVGGFGGGEKGTGEGEKGVGGHGEGRTPCANGGWCRGGGGCGGEGGCGGKGHKVNKGSGRGRGQGGRGGCKDIGAGGCGDEGNGHRPGGAEPCFREGDVNHGGGGGEREKRGKSGGGKPCSSCEASIPCPVDALGKILCNAPPLPPIPTFDISFGLGNS